MTFFSAKKTDIDLLARYNFDPKKQEKRLRTLAYTLPGALVLALIVAVILFNLIKGLVLDSRIRDYELKIALLSSSGENLSELQEKSNNLGVDYKLMSQALEKSSEEALGYGNLNLKLLADINSACGSKAAVKHIDFSSEKISFTFETTSLNYGDISLVVKEIEDIEYFEDVSYSGYLKESDEAYSFSVVCSFKGFDEESEVAK